MIASTIIQTITIPFASLKMCIRDSPGDVGNRRSGSDVQQVGVCAGGGQTSDQTILEHIGAAAGVLTDDDAGRLVVAVAFTQSVVIPAQETPHFICVVGGQSDSGFAADAIGSKILSNY